VRDIGTIRINLVGGENETRQSVDRRESSSDNGAGASSSAPAEQRFFIFPREGSASVFDEIDEDGTDGTPSEEDLDLEVTNWVAAGLSEVIQRVPEVQRREGNLMRREVRNPLTEFPPAERDVVNSPGQPLIYTDLGRRQSFIDITGRRVRSTTSSNAPNPQDSLNQITRDEDSWVIRPRPSAQEEKVSTRTDGESSDTSEEYFDALTPLPSPPPSPPIPTHERTSVSSTGATIGSEAVLGEATKEAKKEDVSFSKERRARLLAEMNADIARHSQEREWAFYREQGYSVLPRIHYPETAQSTIPVNNRGRARNRRSPPAPTHD